MKFIGVYDYTVILTYMSLISGLLGMKLAYDGKIIWAILCLFISGFCDMFDVGFLGDSSFLLTAR